MQQITLPADIRHIGEATAFVYEMLDKSGCPQRTRTQIDVALDELLSNVVRYAYPPKTGNFTIGVEILADPRRAVITLTDQGVPYDPLKKPDPDVTLSAQDRQIGGLGIYIVKKTMDAVTYDYLNGSNIVTIVKRF